MSLSKTHEQNAGTSHPIRIVGIGASAGGLQPLKEFIKQIPTNSGLAYIVVQHLHPTQKDLLPELLQAITAIPVLVAKQHLLIEPNCVYVIPPGMKLSVVKGHLHLTKYSEPRGIRLPIDILFISLAGERGKNAIAVILSGMGSDGALGMRAVKAVGGVTAVQQPETAQFDSMPKSAIEMTDIDIVASASELPARILSFGSKEVNAVSSSADETSAESENASILRIMELLQQRTGHNFSQYKSNTLHRRIQRRMSVHSIAKLTRYADFLGKNSTEIDLLFQELLIGVTSFFRDAPVWAHMADVVLPELLTRRIQTPKLRAWVIGCSTGEEVFSLAIIFAEVIKKFPKSNEFELHIFASDINSEAIAIARQGVFPLSISKSVSNTRLKKFFTYHDTHYEINPEIRDMVLFTRHDVLQDPPFTKLDLIVCRNLLIYFNAELQQKLLPLYHYSLNENGMLLLGNSESIGRFNYLFNPIDAKLRTYLRLGSLDSGSRNFLMRSLPLNLQISKEKSVSPPKKNDSSIDNSLKSATDEVLLQVHAPAAVLINKSGDIVYISGRTGKYLEPAAGKVNWNVHAMVREGIREPVLAALKKIATGNTKLQNLQGLQVSLPGSIIHNVDVTVHALSDPGVLKDMVLIVFRDVEPVTDDKIPRSISASGKRHAEELQRKHVEIQTLRDEARTNAEELQSAIEEFQSTNEELQSTNEELTTSKEEMQSMNEELQTINGELHSKVDELSLAQSDMKNLLNSVDIAILFLDQKLYVRRFTDMARNIFSIRDNDIGRPLSDLQTTLQYKDLKKDALEVLRSLSFKESQIKNDGGQWYKVRIMPYRRLDNVIDGLVITFLDISLTKSLETSLNELMEK